MKAEVKSAFQSTPPVKAATIKIWFYAFSVIISIHAAREGGDIVALPFQKLIYISIHAAREGGDVCHTRKH